MGAYYFVNLLQRVTFRGLQRCQLTFTCYLEDATVYQVLSQVIGVCAVRGKQVSNGCFVFVLEQLPVSRFLRINFYQV